MTTAFTLRFLAILPSNHSRGPGQHGNAQHNAVHSKRREAAFADVAHEPGNRSIGNDERHDETDGEDDRRWFRQCGKGVRVASWIRAAMPAATGRTLPVGSRRSHQDVTNFTDKVLFTPIQLTRLASPKSTSRP